MEFARNLLKKYGWEEGQGLGKKNDGISVPLRASLKFDKAGLGEKKGEEFSNHWWERVFNDAANNINVKKGEESVEIEIKDEDSVEITTKEHSLKKLRRGNNGGYKYFLKKSTLNGLREKPESELEKAENFPKYKTLTDEELFAACGGRTAHKGARHGLNLTGKLSRIEKQERELLQKMQDQNQSGEDWKVVKNKKKRRRDEDQIDKDSGSQNILFTNEYHLKSKKKKKKEKQLDNDMSLALSSVGIGAEVENTDVEMTSAKDHKKKREKRDQITCSENGENKSAEMLDEEISSSNQNDTETSHKKKKKKKKEQSVENLEDDICHLKSNEIRLGENSKEKRRKLGKCTENVAGELKTSLELKFIA